jgi:hypothetical protein
MSQSLYNAAFAQYDPLVKAKDNAYTAYTTQLAAVNSLFSTYAAKRTAYTQAQQTYDNAVSALNFSDGRKTTFSGYSQNADTNDALITPAGATLKSATQDKWLKQSLFDAASDALDASRVAFNSAMDTFTRASANKDDAEGKVGEAR